MPFPLKDRTGYVRNKISNVSGFTPLEIHNGNNAAMGNGSTSSSTTKKRHLLSLTAFTPLENCNNRIIYNGNVSNKTNKKKHFLSLTGFTFIEILMVVVILSIFVAMATPRFRITYLDLQLSSQAENLAKFLNYAQERAVVERKTYCLQIDPMQQRYWLTVEEVKEGDDEVHFARIEGRYGRIAQLPTDISLESQQEEILFYPDGSSDPFTLSLRNQVGRELILKNGRPFGYVHVEEAQPT